MGISNRDYIRDEPPSWGGGGGGGFAPASDHWAIKSIIISCVVVFFVQTLTGQPSGGGLIGGATDWLKLSWEGLTQFKIWGLVTHGFCHGSIQHLFWNMLGLYVFSRALEDIYGSRELFAFFLVTVAISGLAEVAVGRATGHYFGVVGASGGLMGMLLLSAWHYPTRRIGLFFLPITFELRWIAAFYVIGDVIQTLAAANNGVANLAHLSGGLVGYLYFQWGGRILPTSSGYSTSRRRGGLKRFFSKLKPSRVKSSVRLYEPPSEPETASGLDGEVDRLLDKINREGKDSLTPEENEILLKASKTYRNRV